VAAASGLAEAVASEPVPSADLRWAAHLLECVQVRQWDPAPCQAAAEHLS